MNLDIYLKRIGISEKVRPDLASLQALHRAHLFIIPYENFDIQLGRTVGLALPPIFEKIVMNGRGGWCYEMNGLFGWALGEVGFRVTRVPGAVMRELRGDAWAGNHLVLKVALPEGDYLADVGFGNGTLEPVRIETGEFQSHGFSYRLSRPDENWWRLHQPPGNGPISFDFNTNPANEAVLAERSLWLQSAPESSFVQNAVCYRYTKDGLAILKGCILRMLMPQDQVDHRLQSADEYISVLKSVFDLHLPEARSLWANIHARNDQVIVR